MWFITVNLLLRKFQKRNVVLHWFGRRHAPKLSYIDSFLSVIFMIFHTKMYSVKLDGSLLKLEKEYMIICCVRSERAASSNRTKTDYKRPGIKCAFASKSGANQS